MKRKKLESTYSELEALCIGSPSGLSKNVVRGEGNVDSPVVFVGEAPGAEEDHQKRPFVGAAGRVLTSALENAGWRRNDVFITNLVKCRPPQNKPPRKLEIQHFLPYLRRELEVIKPAVTCLLGATATRALTGRQLAEIRGKTIEIDDRPYFSTYHPATVVYNVNLEKMFFEHIIQLRKLVLHELSED